MPRFHTVLLGMEFSGFFRPLLIGVARMFVQPAPLVRILTGQADSRRMKMIPCRPEWCSICALLANVQMCR
jgi:hypothetical protein